MNIEWYPMTVVITIVGDGRNSRVVVSSDHSLKGSFGYVTHGLVQTELDMLHFFHPEILLVMLNMNEFYVVFMLKCFYVHIYICCLGRQSNCW